LRPTWYASRLVLSRALLNPVPSSSHIKPATLLRGHCCTHSLCRVEYLRRAAKDAADVWQREQH
jgi:hypothetical protein